jgi:hypothetical protein
MVGNGGESVRCDEPACGYCWNPNSWKSGVTAAEEAVDGSGRHWKQALPCADSRTVGASLPAKIPLMCKWRPHQSHFTAIASEAWPEGSFHGFPQHLVITKTTTIHLTINLYGQMIN